MSADLITPQESVRLCELERVIQKFKDSGIEAANALKEIQDSKLYVTFGTFDEYTEKRWGWKRSRVYQLIEFAAITENLKMSTVVDTPTSERQTRPLAKLPAEQQPAAWERAHEIAKEESKPVAARHVEAAVLEVMPKEEPDTVVVDGVADPSGMPTKAKPLSKEEEDESFTLMELKRLWKKAGKKDRTKFLDWTK